MKKAISYIRMSSEIQLKGNSLARQKEITSKYVKENKLYLVENLEDLGLSAYSGKHTKSGKFGKFLSSIDDELIDNDLVLLVESLDRLSREDPFIAFSQFTKIINYGIEIHTIFDRQIYTKESMKANPSQMFISLGTMIRAYDESDTKSKRLKKAWSDKRQNISKGLLTKILPAWLKYDEKANKIITIPAVVKSIKKIFELSVDENMGSYSITRYLNANLKEYPKGVMNSRSSPVWGSSYVKKILSSTSVYGEFQPHKMLGGKRIPDGSPVINYFPVIIEKDYFLLSKERTNRRKVNGSGRKGDEFTNLFGQLLFCGKCGTKFILKNKGGVSKDNKYLTCRNKDDGNCNAPSWQYSEFEEAFLRFTLELPLKEIFVETDRKKEEAIIKKQMRSVKSKQIEEEEKFKKLIKRILIVDELLVQDLNDETVKVKEGIGNLKSSYSNLELDLVRLTEKNTAKIHEGLIRGIKEFKQKKSADEIKKLRQRLNLIIRNLIDKIVIRNTPSKIEPWESGLLAPEFIQQFEENKTSRTKYDNIEDYISSAYGQRKINEFERTFVVYFNNGATRMVQPSMDFSLKSDTKNKFMLLKKEGN